MRYLAYCTTAVFAMVVSCYVHAGAAGKTDLVGTWEVTELVAGGMKVPDKDIAGMKFVFAKDKDETKLTITPPTADGGIVEKRTFTVTIDGAKKPATVDLVALDGDFKGTKSPGIFEIQGNVLRWCQPDDPKDAKRPTEFKSPEKSSIYLFTFKRGK